PGHALPSAAVPDPDDPGGVDVPVQHAARDRGLLADDGVGVLEGGGGGGLDAGLGVVLVAHHDVAVGGQVLLQVVVPGVVVAVAVADDHERELAHGRDARGGG